LCVVVTPNWVVDGIGIVVVVADVVDVECVGQVHGQGQ
jgi:hypothetical protein